MPVPSPFEFHDQRLVDAGFPVGTHVSQGSNGRYAVWVSYPIPAGNGQPIAGLGYRLIGKYHDFVSDAVDAAIRSLPR